MKKLHLTFFLILAAAIGLPILGWILFVGPKEHSYPFKLSDRLAWLDISTTGDGAAVTVTMEYGDGRREVYPANSFLKEVAEAQGERRSVPPLVFRRVLNLTSWTGVFWVCIGLFGQVLFTGRMLIQWLVSEKQRRSVVPVSFWWLSLAGASMLIIYFTWRVDAVGILGQSTGWFVYLRNLWLIYSAEETESEKIGQGSSENA